MEHAARGGLTRQESTSATDVVLLHHSQLLDMTNKKQEQGRDMVSIVLGRFQTVGPREGMRSDVLERSAGL